jgi:hypothetical protein
MIRRVAVVLLLAAPAVFAQAPSDDWRTMRTAHFRIHYPAPYEAWTKAAAARIESVRAAVVQEVGFDPPQVADVVVQNPRAESNGATYSLLDTPRIVLWSEPPPPESSIGEFRDWIELLEVHEMAHLVHLLRPSRNPMRRLAEKLLPLNPIALAAPRWVLEGYATVVEGRITGSGRPSSSFRAAVLRKWAASGRMPSYGELAGNRRFMGMSMAYLAGSAYLEWLEQRATPGALHALWARMTARQTRSFEQAFEGVFGDRPDRLYGAFVAELTAKALQGERSGALREGELWQETSRASGEPAVSPDGKQLVIVLRDEKRRAKLVVWPTGPNPEEAKVEERIAKMLKRDPQDVAPLRAKPLPREPLHSYEPLDGGDVESPRWTRDGQSIVFSHRQPDRDGFLHHDLFRWWPESGRVARITHLADVHDADPLPDGARVVAVRSRAGFTQLVKVDLGNGAVLEEVTPPSLERVLSHPRASASGALAWTEHSAEGWHVVRDGARVGNGFSEEWTPSGDLVGVVAGGGTIDIARLEGPAFLTRVSGAAFAPAPAPDGSLYFMSLEPDGFVVRRLSEMSPVGHDVAPPTPPGPSLALTATPESHPYGIGRQELSVLFGGQYTAHERNGEVGVRMGDVIGRLDVIAIAGRGAALAAVYRGLPVDLGLHLFNHGAEVRGTWRATFPLAETQWRAGTLACRSRDRQECLSSTFFDGFFSTHQRDFAAESLSFAADSKRHAQATLDARFKWLRVTATEARRVAVGGVGTSVEPESLFIGRILDPALPPDAAFAERYRGARVALVSGPLSLFAQRHHAGRDLDVVGIEATLSRDPMPIVKAAGVDVTAGVARVRQERANRAWLAIRWRP